LGPMIIEFLSRGRWNVSEQGLILYWLKWILLGSVGIGASFVLSSWQVLRTKISHLIFTVYIPLAVIAMVIYYIAIQWSGLRGAAMAHAPVMGLYLFLLLFRYLALRGKTKTSLKI